MFASSGEIGSFGCAKLCSCIACITALIKTLVGSIDGILQDLGSTLADRCLVARGQHLLQRVVDAGGRFADDARRDWLRCGSGCCSFLLHLLIEQAGTLGFHVGELGVRRCRVADRADPFEVRRPLVARRLPVCAGTDVERVADSVLQR